MLASTRLRDLRPEGTSIRAAAEEIGVSHDTLSRYEREGDMPVWVAAALAELYGVSVTVVVEAALEVRRCHLHQLSMDSPKDGQPSSS